MHLLANISLMRMAAFVLGSSVGWLVGLSLSPVVHIMVAAIMSLVVTVTGVAVGVNELKGKRFEFNPRFLVWLTIGMAIGAPIGVFVRSNEYLAANPGRIAERWSVDEASSNVVRKALLTMWLENAVRQKPVASEEKGERLPWMGGLIDTPEGFCAVISDKRGNALRYQITNSIPGLRKLASGLNDEQLEELRAILCRR